MKLRDIFNYDNEKYGRLRDSARAVSNAYLTANRYLDQCKEFLYTEFGTVNFSNVVHGSAHTQLERLDIFGDLLHERHLMQEYPSTEELDIREEVKDMNDIFALIVRIYDNVQEALEKFHAVTDNADFRPMALKVEELMLANSKDYTKILAIWQRYDTDGGSLTSFDSWVKQYAESGEVY